VVVLFLSRGTVKANQKGPNSKIKYPFSSSLPSDVPGETSTGSIGILVSEVKYVEHQKAMNAMGDVDSGRNVISGIDGIELRRAEEDREESSRIEGSGGFGSIRRRN
jgi:hypothetical protein